MRPYWTTPILSDNHPPSPRGICESQRQGGADPVGRIAYQGNARRRFKIPVPPTKQSLSLPWVELAGWIMPYACSLDIVGDLAATGPIMVRGGGTCTIIFSYSALTIAAADDKTTRRSGSNWTYRRRSCRTDYILH